MNQQKIRLGIIGAGKVTTLPGRHLDSILELEDSDVEIIAIADTSPGLAQQAAKDFHIPYAFEDYHDLLALSELDAVTINTPTHTHKSIAIDCFLANKHVYLEKPVTSTKAELQEILAVARTTDRVFLGGSNGLLQRQMGLFKQMIDQNQLGEVYMVSIDRASSRNHVYGLETKPKCHEGISTHSGSHNVEWALYFLGDPAPVSVVAKGYYKECNLSTPTNTRDEDDDCCIATVFFDNGSSFLFKALRAAPEKDTYEMKIYGDKMTIHYDVQTCYKQKSDDCIRFYEYDTVVGMKETRPIYRCGRTHADMYRHFFQCIRQGTTSLCNGDRGLVTMQILDAITTSIDSGGKQIFLNQENL